MTKESRYSNEPNRCRTKLKVDSVNKMVKGLSYDLTGMSFGDLTVLKFKKRIAGKENNWLCRCVCGNEIFTRAADLRSGRTKNCGCLRRRGLCADLTGRRFGKLIVSGINHRDKHGRVMWKCVCDCGEKTINATNTLRMKRVIQCYKCGRKFKEAGHSGLTVLIKK